MGRSGFKSRLHKNESMKKLTVNYFLALAREHCLECMGGARKAVTECPVVHCRWYDHRFGNIQTVMWDAKYKPEWIAGARRVLLSMPITFWWSEYRKKVLSGVGAPASGSWWGPLAPYAMSQGWRQVDRRKSPIRECKGRVEFCYSKNGYHH